MSKKNKEKAILHMNAVSAVVMVSAIALGGIVFIAIRAQRLIKSLLTDGEVGNFFNFGS